ncbi:MAG TPA: hypothetical protein VHM19_20260 [Polyangiales bacterium]|nr:hypothetical protein [Polyangiales bacterium]
MALAFSVNLAGCAGDKDRSDRGATGKPQDSGFGSHDSGSRDAGMTTMADAAAADSGMIAQLDAATDAEQPDLTCGVQTSTAHIGETRPVDVIFVIDNSGSMSDEIQAVQDNINDNFAHIIEDSGADYRVIMLTSHGDAASCLVCISAPLSTTTCNPIPAAPANNPPRFYHYDFNVQSWDSLCRILETYDVPDTHGFSLTGWQEWLRPEALKVFVEITDDDANCTTARGNFTPAGSGDPLGDNAMIATAFNTALLALSPTQFGTKAKPNYVWHSIVGLRPNTPAEAPWTAKAPVQSGLCSTAAAAGQGYQMLSIATGGLRYPVCEGMGFDAVFRAIAGDVVKSSNVTCHFAVPAAPPGKYVDLKTVAVEYTPSTGGKTEQLKQVAETSCNSTGFVVDKSEVTLCPDACTRVRKDTGAQLGVRFECGEKPPDAPQ